MSTETLRNAEGVKKLKKHKKGTKDGEGHTKKRRRHDGDEKHVKETAVATSQPENPPSKKHKKDAGSEIEARTSESPFSSGLLLSRPPFIQQTTSFYLPLSPCTFRSPLKGLCAEHLSPLLLTYHPKLRGIVLAYDNARMSEHPSDGASGVDAEPRQLTLTQSLDEYGSTFVWLTADFLLFRPERGTYIEGYVNLQNESMLGLLCYNYFNVGIERDKLPSDWHWVDGDAEAYGERQSDTLEQFHSVSGHFADSTGRKIEGKLVIRVDDFEATPASMSSLSINGTLLPPG